MDSMLCTLMLQVSVTRGKNVRPAKLRSHHKQQQTTKAKDSRKRHCGASNTTPSHDKTASRKRPSYKAKFSKISNKPAAPPAHLRPCFWAATPFPHPAPSCHPTDDNDPPPPPTPPRSPDDFAPDCPSFTPPLPPPRCRLLTWKTL